MSALQSFKRINGHVQKVTSKLAFIAPLVTRVVLGLAFFHAGTGKFQNFERTVGFFDSIGLPFPAFNAGLVASMETVGGIMLIVGLFTRFFASGLSITMMVALMTAHRADFFTAWSSASEVSPTDITAFVFLLFLVWLILYGAGWLSLDTVLRKVLRTETRQF